MLLTILILAVSVDNIISTPAVIAGFFGLLGMFLTKIWDNMNKRRDKNDEKLNAAYLSREAAMAKEREEFLEEQRAFRQEMQDEVKLLRVEVNQLRAENIQLRSENLGLSLNYKEGEKIRKELKDKITELERRLHELTQ